jgi:hypothetical protein
MKMSTTNSPALDHTDERERQVKIISHSPIFYWWPVWVVGFLMAFLTYWGDHRMALVPTGTVAERNRQVEGHEGRRDVLVVPPHQQLPLDDVTDTLMQPRLQMAVSNSPGVLFTLVLLLVIVITNVHMRGMWSLVVIITIIFLSILFAALGWWDPILRAFGVLDIHINSLGYLSISLLLLAIWLLTFLLYDRRFYIVFSPGQFRVHLAVGMGETAYETLGMVVEKRREDVFRHWLLGFGSGDITVRTGGATPQQFEMPNVLFVGRKIDLIQQLLREREVVRT